MSLSMVLEKQAALVAQCPAPPSIPEEEASKLPIHVERVGTSGPLVLIIHGGVQGGAGGGPATFVKQKALAEHGWQVAIVDRPGFGQSPSRGVDDMERDAAWIADMLGDGAHLIGHSWGGAETLLAAARRPEAVRSLVLVEPALQVLAMADPAADPATKATVGRMAEPMLTSQTPADYALAFIRMLGTNDDTTSRMVGNFSAEVATRFGCSILQARMAPPPVLLRAAETVAKAKVPVLLISGGWSPMIEAVCSVTTRLTGGRHASVPSANHFPQLDNATEFNRVIEAFMKENGAGAS